MDWREAARLRGIPRIEWLCSDANPDAELRERWRAHVVERAATPPVHIKAASLGRAFWDWAVSGFRMASEDEARRRMNICVACPEWERGRCRICGCFLAPKVRMKTEHCPIYKW